MNFSLILVAERHSNGTVSGTWLQGQCGKTLEQAQEHARKTMEVNSNKIDVAVVREITFSQYEVSKIAEL